MDFTETADIETSSDDYASRFSGSVGEWFLKVQADVTLAMLKDSGTTTVLDVGGGHGQLAAPLTEQGFETTVLGSDESCKTRIAGIVDAGGCTFTVGDVIKLPFDDNSFDSAISFRLLPHCTAWETLISELCRVARKSVIVDYPTAQSFNCVAPALFGAKKKIEGNTRDWTMFSHKQIATAFESNGFSTRKRRPEFFFPMVLHRTMRIRVVSVFIEAIARCLGLTARLGSPVIAEMRPT